MSSRATQILMDEHRVIEGMLAVLRRAADKVEAGGRVDPSVFERAIDFIRNYADGFHHAKEEKALFKTMAAHGIPQQHGPIGVMLTEHDQGRAHVRMMAEALPRYASGDPEAAKVLVKHARGYADLLTTHIYKEDNILYPMSEQAVPEADQETLLEDYSRLESEVLTPEQRERYMGMVEELEKEV